MALKKQPKSIDSIEEPKVSIDTFCDLKGVGRIDRMACNRHYKEDLMSVSDWIEELSDKIVLK